MKKTITIIRKTRGKNGQIFALFPCIPFSFDLGLCMSYARVGQHSAAQAMSSTYSKAPNKEDKEEVKRLLRELRRIGYKPRLVKRNHYSYFEQRRKELYSQ